MTTNSFLSSLLYALDYTCTNSHIIITESQPPKIRATGKRLHAYRSLRHHGDNASIANPDTFWILFDNLTPTIELLRNVLELACNMSCTAVNNKFKSITNCTSAVDIHDHKLSHKRFDNRSWAIVGMKGHHATMDILGRKAWNTKSYKIPRSCYRQGFMKPLNRINFGLQSTRTKLNIITRFHGTTHHTTRSYSSNTHADVIRIINENTERLFFLVCDFFPSALNQEVNQGCLSRRCNRTIISMKPGHIDQSFIPVDRIQSRDWITVEFIPFVVNAKANTFHKRPHSTKYFIKSVLAVSDKIHLSDDNNQGLHAHSVGQ
mmetsp:Transcript_6105/g.8958  ORF Transcript_6105/g.8958 Transcript_6105/m.8958 type:complete len:319 (+) Transcript_6105:187-1143(+)